MDDFCVMAILNWEKPKSSYSALRIDCQQKNLALNVFPIGVDPVVTTSLFVKIPDNTKFDML